jgi:hypothetical protein
MEGTEEPHTDKYMENVNESNYTTICMLTAIQTLVFLILRASLLLHRGYVRRNDLFLKDSTPWNLIVSLLRYISHNQLT